MDLIEIERIRQARERARGFAARICTERELAYCGADPSGQRLAGRFAAKEAVAKALGIPLSWHDVEVLPDAFGKPIVRLRARPGSVLVTITHTRSHAAACAIWLDDDVR